MLLLACCGSILFANSARIDAHRLLLGQGSDQRHLVIDTRCRAQWEFTRSVTRAAESSPEVRRSSASVLRTSLAHVFKRLAKSEHPNEI